MQNFRNTYCFVQAFKSDVTNVTNVNMINRRQYLTVLHFDLCAVQCDNLDHYKKGVVPQKMFPISYVKVCITNSPVLTQDR